MIHLHIIHAKYLANRAPLFQALVGKLKEANLLASVSLHSEKDPNEIVGQDVGLFTNQPIPDGDKLAYFNTVLKQMTLPQLSNTLKHVHALMKISGGATDPDSVHLVVEDDILFPDNVVALITIAAQQFQAMSHPQKICFLGAPSPATSEPIIRDIGEYYKIIPCCESFFINKAAATAILGDCIAPPNRIRFVTNVQLTYTLLKLEIPIKIMAPHIFVDGSKYGAVNSNIELNNRLLLNPNYNLIVQAIDALPKDGTAKRLQDIDQMFARFEFKGSPEFYFLKARYETILGNYHFAKAIFDYIYNMQVTSGAPLSQGSEFMREYMKIFKYMQK